MSYNRPVLKEVVASITQCENNNIRREVTDIFAKMATHYIKNKDKTG